MLVYMFSKFIHFRWVYSLTNNTAIPGVSDITIYNDVDDDDGGDGDRVVENLYNEENAFMSNLVKLSPAFWTWQR